MPSKLAPEKHRQQPEPKTKLDKLRERRFLKAKHIGYAKWVCNDTEYEKYRTMLLEQIAQLQHDLEHAQRERSLLPLRMPTLVRELQELDRQIAVEQQLENERRRELQRERSERKNPSAAAKPPRTPKVVFTAEMLERAKTLGLDLSVLLR